MWFLLDYRVLNNKQSIRNYLPIPHTGVLIDKTQGSRTFSILDLWYEPQQVRMHPPDILKTAFSPHCVPLFGLTNAQQTFQTLIKSLLRHLHFVSVYLE